MVVLAAAMMAAAVATEPAPCRSCHAEQHAAWERSRHARASTGPLVQRMREWASRDGGEAVAESCANCHSVPLVDGSARSAMVTCEACHQGTAQAPAAAGWVIDPQRPVRGVRGRGAAPHEVVVADLSDNALCLVCHSELHNPAGVPLCTTGPEHEAVPDAPSCAACHAEGGDHRFAGTSHEMLARAATLAVALEGGNAVVTVTNSGAGHALPTGSALREVRLEVTFHGADGTPLGSNAGDHGARLSKVLADAAGNAPAPAWRAATVQHDRRLAFGETRRFTYPLPAGTSRVEARLVYRRAPVAVASRLGLDDDPDLAPVLMTMVAREVAAPATVPAADPTARTGR